MVYCAVQCALWLVTGALWLDECGLWLVRYAKIRFSDWLLVNAQITMVLPTRFTCCSMYLSTMRSIIFILDHQLPTIFRSVLHCYLNLHYYMVNLY